MQRNIFVFIFTSLLILLITASLEAQNRETGSIIGRVTQEDGQGLPGANVRISSEFLIEGARLTQTDAVGRYRFPVLPPGIYAIEAEMQGFHTIRHKDLQVYVGKTLTVDIILPLETASVTMDISGDAQPIDVTSAAVTHTVPLHLIENLPKSQTDFAYSFATITPGVNEDFVAFGAAAFTGTAYWFDGVDFSNPACGCPFVEPSQNWVEEIQVSGVGAPAEYGEFSGVVLNAVSRSGGNDLHGLTEIFFANDSFVSENTSDPLLNPAKVNHFFDTTVQLGGPILQDKLWFFTGLQYTNKESRSFGAQNITSLDTPKLIAKLSSKFNSNNTLQGFFEFQRS